MNIDTGIYKVIELIDAAITDPNNSEDTQISCIRSSFDEEISRLSQFISNSHSWLDDYRMRLIEESGIQSLKIKYTSASGYFIEISKSQLAKIPESFTHKQTLVNASRFISDELMQYEKDLMNAEELLKKREQEILEQIRLDILVSDKEIRQLAGDTAELDVICSLSTLALERNYCKPELHEDYELEIIGGRHPVLETIHDDFIENDLHLNQKNFCHIITGPNMGGKSTFLRQNTLIVLLAHVGSYVPAKSAKIPLSDKLFSRIGASDNLFLGQSTFMLEMQEVAYILANATSKSFVIIDEIGRGTSTYDGMSLAWAILKENHDRIKAKTLFSTHYHELCDEAEKLPGSANYSVSVGEGKNGLVFLRKIIPGAIYKSYGLEVAKIAGLNSSVLDEAKKMLQKLKKGHTAQYAMSFSEQSMEIPNPKLEAIKKLEINAMSPIEALQYLERLQKDLD